MSLVDVSANGLRLGLIHNSRLWWLMLSGLGLGLGLMSTRVGLGLRLMDKRLGYRSARLDD